MEVKDESIGPMKPPFSYYGGKQKLASKIIPLIPRHTVYAEPFCGSAAIFFKKPYPKITNNCNYREAINDTNKWIVNFFRVLRNEIKSYELARQVLLTPYSRAEHDIAKKIMKKEIDDIDNVQAAWAFFAHIRMAFTGKLSGGWGFGVFGANNAISSSLMIDLLPYAKRLKGVYIDNLDAGKFIKHWDSPQTFFFCDPPYPETEQGHYGGYSKDDFKKLCETLNNCNASFILTCYPFEGIKEMLPKDVEIFKFRRFASSKKIGDNDSLKKASKEEIEACYREEWIIRRFAKVEPRDEIKKLYSTGAYDCFTGDSIDIEDYLKKYGCSYESLMSNY